MCHLLHLWQAGENEVTLLCASPEAPHIVQRMSFSDLSCVLAFLPEQAQGSTVVEPQRPISKTGIRVEEGFGTIRLSLSNPTASTGAVKPS
jgi:hypothetical protein